MLLRVLLPCLRRDVWNQEMWSQSLEPYPLYLLASLTVTTVLWSHLDNEQILNFINYLGLINVTMFSPTRIQKLPHKAHMLQSVDMSFKSLLIYWVIFYLFFSCSLFFEEIEIIVLLRVSHRILLTAFLVASLIWSPVPCITCKLVVGSKVLNRSRLIFLGAWGGRGKTTWNFGGGGMISYDRSEEKGMCNSKVLSVFLGKMFSLLDGKCLENLHRTPPGWVECPASVLPRQMVS